MRKFFTRDAATHLTAAIVGGLVSGILVLVSVYIQLNAQRNESRYNRKVDLVAAYTRACNQLVVDSKLWHDRWAEQVDYRTRGIERFPPSTFDDLANDMYNHSLDLKIQADKVNYIFGPQVEPISLLSLGPVPQQTAQEDDAQIRVILPTFTKRCADDTARLSALVGK